MTDKLLYNFALYCITKLPEDQLLDFTTDFQMLLRDYLSQKMKLANTYDNGLITYTNDEIEKTIIETMNDLDDYIERIRLNWDEVFKELLS